MDRRVQEILRLIESNDLNLHLQNPLDELASSLGLSGSRLRHIFRAETGLTITQVVLDLRLQRAKRFFETSRLSVKQVAAEVGMRDESYFVQAFKKAYGVTPGCYRSHANSAAGPSPRPTHGVAPASVPPAR